MRIKSIDWKHLNDSEISIDLTIVVILSIACITVLFVCVEIVSVRQDDRRATLCSLDLLSQLQVTAQTKRLNMSSFLIYTCVCFSSFSSFKSEFIYELMA